MQLINQNFKILEQSTGLEGIYKQVEKAGRVCYKSENKITEDSAKPFVDRMIKSGHGAVLEHGTIYLKVYSISKEDWDKRIGQQHLWTVDEQRDYLQTNPTYDNNEEENWWAKDARHIAAKMLVKYADNPYSKVNVVLKKHEINTNGGVIIAPTSGYPRVSKTSQKLVSVFNTVLITTNLRVLVENDWLDDLQYICEPTKYHEKRITVQFVLPIGISREFCRHRTFSFAEMSTRYCNFNKDKFGKELTFIKDNWSNPNLLQLIETEYIKAIESGQKPQEARNILPLCTKTELVMTGFIRDWEHFFHLRDNDAAHPMAKEVAHNLHEVFKKNNWVHQ